MILELVRRHLWSDPERPPAEAAEHALRSHARAVLIVRAFYALGLVWMGQQMGSWPDLRSSEVIDPLWPAQWVTPSDPTAGITAILVAHVVATLTAAAVPWWRPARAAAALTLLEVMALTNGFGKIGHGMHGWLWVSAILVLLPGRAAWRADASAELRRQVVRVIVLAQVVLLGFYSMTGAWKVAESVAALFRPPVSGFEIDGFAYLIGENLLATGRETLVGDLLVRTPVLGWALYNATMYLELTSVVIAFRPRLHRAWGLGLIGFHLGTQAAMGILFPVNIALLGLLLIGSPEAPDRVDLLAAWRDLPGVRLARSAVRSVRSRRHAPAAAPG